MQIETSFPYWKHQRLAWDLWVNLWQWWDFYWQSPNSPFSLLTPLLHQISRVTGGAEKSWWSSSVRDALTGSTHVLGVDRGLGRLKSPRAECIVCTESHGVHPVRMTLKCTAENSLGKRKYRNKSLQPRAQGLFPWSCYTNRVRLITLLGCLQRNGLTWRWDRKLSHGALQQQGQAGAEPSYIKGGRHSLFSQANWMSRVPWHLKLRPPSLKGNDLLLSSSLSQPHLAHHFSALTSWVRQTLMVRSCEEE